MGAGCREGIVDGKDAARKFRPDMAVEPGPQPGALEAIPVHRRRHRDRKVRLVAIPHCFLVAAELGLTEHGRPLLARKMISADWSGNAHRHNRRTDRTGNPRRVDVLRAKTPSAAARCGFLVEGAVTSDLPDRAACLVVRTSSAIGGAPSHLMIASSPKRGCFFSSGVNSSSIPQACPSVVQSMRPLRRGGNFR
jgi:hypothetical protein